MTPRATLADAFDSARTAEEILALSWRVVDYRDASKDPTAQAVIDALGALRAARIAFDGAAGAWSLHGREYREWLGGMRAILRKQDGQPIECLPRCEEHKVYKRRENAYLAEEQWYGRVRAMAERLMLLWAAMEAP